MSVKVRFAPSPTGLLHIGNVRTAIITWLFTKSQQGQFVLRIDDTDVERSKDEYTQAIKEDLTWLGMHWDQLEHQRDRQERYDGLIEKLKNDGRLYPCYETPTELELKRKSLMARSLPPIYDREALELTEEQKAAFEAEGRRPHWRFKMDHAPIEWEDHVRGQVSFHGKDLSDPVLIREDGTPLYHICSVIDDIDFGITHVVRGEDHVTNTACHVQMFEALGAKVPEFAHLPLLSDAQGGKLSKRLGSLSVQSLRNDEHIEPMSIISFLSRLGTSDPIEAYADAAPLIESFDFAKFSKGAPKCDEEEIYRLNAKIIRDMPYSVASQRLDELDLNESVVSEDYWMAVRPNLSKFNELKMWVDVTHGQVNAELSAEDQDYIEMVRGLLPEGPWDDQTWSQWISAIKGQTDRKGKALFMPLRLALTGMNHGPELDKMLPILGEEKVLDRLSLKSKAA